MENIIEIKNLSFRYEHHFIFDKLNINIKRGEWVSIVGPNGSGKTTLVKLLVGLIPTDSDVVIDGLKLSKSNIMEIRKRIGIVFENSDDQFVAETVRDDIAFSLENLAYSPYEINHLVNDMAKKLDTEYLLECEPHRLSGGEKQKVALASALITNPKILILDEALEMIDPHYREEMITIIKKLHEEGTTIINITHNLEDTYYGDRIIVLNDGNVLIEGPTKLVLWEDKLLSHVGLEIPFMVDLSLKLHLYGLVDDIILDMDKMVMHLWK